jgi:hypothetical protein
LQSVQIANYEAEEERKRKEREEAAASEGWTVVKRHKVRFAQHQVDMCCTLACTWHL